MNDDDEIENPEVAECEDAIDAAVRRIRTREDLADFVALLKKSYKIGAFEYSEMSDFLGAVTDVLDGLPGLCKNRGQPEPAQPDWRWLGEILLSALVR